MDMGMGMGMGIDTTSGHGYYIERVMNPTLTLRIRSYRRLKYESVLQRTYLCHLFGVVHGRRVKMISRGEPASVNLQHNNPKHPKTPTHDSVSK